MPYAKPLPAFTADTCVAEAVGRSPRTTAVLRRFGMSDCLGCAFAPFDTLAYAAVEHGCDLKALVAALNRVGRG